MFVYIWDMWWMRATIVQLALLYLCSVNEKFPLILRLLVKTSVRTLPRLRRAAVHESAKSKEDTCRLCISTRNCKQNHIVDYSFHRCVCVRADMHQFNFLVSKEIAQCTFHRIGHSMKDELIRWYIYHSITLTCTWFIWRDVLCNALAKVSFSSKIAGHGAHPLDIQHRKFLLF